MDFLSNAISNDREHWTFDKVGETGANYGTETLYNFPKSIFFSYFETIIY